MKRVTLILEDSVYEAVVMESIRRFGSAKKISKVVNEIVKEKLLNKENEIKRLLEKPKIIEISESEFKEFRRELSRRFEDR